MPPVKTETQARNNWEAVAADIRDFFETAISEDEVDWATPTQEASEDWRDGIVSAAQQGLFSQGVHAIGQAAYIARIDAKQNNWIAEVRRPETAQRWRDNFEPYHRLIRMIEEGSDAMPSRQGVDTSRNYRRVQIIAGLFHDLKLSLAGVDHGAMDERPPGWRW